jgi:hypothetical protein
LNEQAPKTSTPEGERKDFSYFLFRFSRLSINSLQREPGRMKLPGEDLMDALSLISPDQGEGWGVGFRTAARYTSALAQKENLDP